MGHKLTASASAAALASGEDKLGAVGFARLLVVTEAAGAGVPVGRWE